ncbi:MAG TPA: prolipoprotein diacylglyceryl transferase [Pseudomonadales bacterium]|nr:prolipoprotein diacylglyceryl transferase [Pseudomonadales bacterium]
MQHPNFDPIAISIGPVHVHWYGLMYLLGFAGAYLLCSLRARRPEYGWSQDQVADMIFYTALGVVLGGRVGYMLIYGWDQLAQNPLKLFYVWEGGMSFHGGLVGVLVASAWYARSIGKSLWDITDFGGPMVPIGLGAGRMGNFINQELWGRATDPDAPWAMYFPKDPSHLPRHPSQLYEFALEGVVMFAVLFWYSRKPRPRMAVSGLFAILYGIFRSLVETVRQPDAQMGQGGFLAGEWLTTGQLLSVPLVMVGVFMMWYAYNKIPHTVNKV